MRRRAFLVLGATGTLGACGFHPLYAPQGQVAGAVQSNLAAIEVPVMPDRSGQLMRQALQARLEGPGLAVPKQYRLIASFGLSSEGIAIEPDTSTSRIRLIGTGTWTLYRTSPTLTVVTSGTSRVLDGLNPISNQPFAQDEEMGTVTRRIAENLADQIVQQIAVYFDKQATGQRRAAASGAPLPS
jgi:LPS-assembly lipoprotein